MGKFPTIQRLQHGSFFRFFYYILFIGNSYGSVRTVINSKSQEFPRWLKLAIVNYEMERERKIEKDPDFNPSIFDNE